MDLLERESSLEALETAYSLTTRSGGRIALIAGEAGIGKTALVECFIQKLPAPVPVLVGGCDALFASRPLGPLYDVAGQLQGDLLDLIRQRVERHAIFMSFLHALQSRDTPTLLFIEDIHWADEGTLDLLKFLSRRIRRIPCLLIVTYRDDELGSRHPLWQLLGDLPPDRTIRLQLSPLSPQAVAQLAHRRSGAPAPGDAIHLNVANLHAVTGGNPFFITEILAGQGADLPASIRQAVLTRAARLSAPARELLDLASVIPTRAPRALLDAVLAPSLSTLEECAASGLVRLEADDLIFRHDLARQALEEAMPPPRARYWHQVVLQILQQDDDANLSRVVHHARAAADDAVIAIYAPRAAVIAADLGAHREAIAHYSVALQVLPAADPTAPRTLSPADLQRATLLETRAYEYYLTGQSDKAIADHLQALAIWQSALPRDDHVRLCEGRNLRWLSRLSWFQGDGHGSQLYAGRAIAVLEEVPPGPERAMAYSNRAQLHMLANENADAIAWGRRAIDLAQQFQDVDTVVHALNNVGTALMYDNDPQGMTYLLSSLRQALEHDMQEHVSRAYTNLGSMFTVVRQYSRALTYLSQGIAYCEERDLDSWTLYMRGWRARVNLEQGQWDQAASEASRVLSAQNAAAVLRLPAHIVLAVIYMRRADARDEEALQRVHDLALATNELQRSLPVAAARAEHAWWQGDLERAASEATPAYEHARCVGNPWEVGLLAFWLWRAGALQSMPPGLPDPYRLQIAGAWQAAAQAWDDLGCPYERAMALYDGDVPAQKQALAIFDRLEAECAARALRRRLRDHGIRDIPQGPRPEKTDNPAGLTVRQWQILGFLVQSLTNKEIAAELVISPKTVDHHVSAILRALDASSRQEAALIAVQSNWFS